MKKAKEWKRRVAAALSAGVLAVTGTAASVSAGFTATAADLDLDNYARLLQYSLYFYDANMCGTDVGESSAFSWRDNCHTGNVVTGGFHDAGDGIQCGLTSGFTASTLGWMYYEYGDAFDTTGTTAHYRVVMDRFCKLFKDSTTLSGNEVTSLVYEMGDDGKDHGLWCAPEVMDSFGASETYSTSNGASNVAAQYAAALAQNYINFGNQEDLDYAVALYNFATKYRKVTYEQSTYSEQFENCQDDISWAAGWLYLATEEEAYLTENAKYTSCNSNWTDDYFYGNVKLGAAIINAEVTGNWSYVTNYISQKVNANQDKFYVMNSWGSARHNTLMQICALVTSKHTESGADYTEWCKKQMNMILGDNNANICLVVGYNDASATSPHHRAASNVNDDSSWSKYNSWDGDYASSNGHTLYGALCGGPGNEDFNTYQKTAKDATSNEVALDYQVGLVGAAAGLFTAYGTGSVVAEIGPEVTVYPDEIAVANGEKPTPGTTTTEETTTTTEATTETSTETTTSDIIVDPADYISGPSEMIVGETADLYYHSAFGDNATDWQSSDPNVLEVVEIPGGGGATVTAKSAGTAIVTAGLCSITITVKGESTDVTTTDTTEETTTTTSETTTTETTQDTTESTTAASSETTTSDTTTSSVIIVDDVLYGDVNLDGRIDLTDAILLNKYCADTVKLSEPQLANGDCNANGQTDMNDSIALLRFLVHSINSLPSAE